MDDKHGPTWGDLLYVKLIAARKAYKRGIYAPLKVSEDELTEANKELIEQM